jgi:DHA2 family multidrug resistance protein
MCAMVASQQLTMSTMPPSLVKNASGLLNLARNVGGAMGLATLSSIVGQGTRQHMGEMSARMGASDPLSSSMLGGLVQRMTEMGVADPEGAARKAMSFIVEKQAMTLAFGEAFAALAVLTFVVGFIALFVERVPRAGIAQPAAPVEQH